MEDIFTELNINLPDDYKGRSLSVSDIIVIDNGIKPEAHYIDNIGFVNLSSFEIQQNLNSNIEYGENRRTREMLDNIVFDGEIDLDKVKEQPKNKLSMEERFKNAKSEADKRNIDQEKTENQKTQEHQR